MPWLKGIFAIEKIQNVFKTFKRNLNNKSNHHLIANKAGKTNDDITTLLKNIKQLTKLLEVS